MVLCDNVSFVVFENIRISKETAIHQNCAWIHPTLFKWRDIITKTKRTQTIPKTFKITPQP